MIRGEPKGTTARRLHGEQVVQYLCGKLSEEMEQKESIKIFREKTGVISKDPLWVCLSGPYMYQNESLTGLFALTAEELEDDKHLGG